MSDVRITLARVHDVLDEAEADDQYRVLVDRLWPRGVKKDRLHYDRWDKDVTPEPELRTAFHAGELSFDEFAERYRAQLRGSDAPAALLDAFRESGASELVLLFAAKDTEHTHALVLRDELEDRR
jgi:uncharacterized protein YeaO (DUF488 family)